MVTNGCKSCTRNVILKKQEIDQILSKNNVHANQFVTNELYKQRLSLCNTCPSFLYGSTCSHSGSIVEYRAKFSNKKCPDPNGARW